MNKKEFSKYLKETERILLDSGFSRTVESDRVSYEWKKETKFGLWFVNVDNDHRSGVASIFTRFKDVDKAMPILKYEGGNVHSGKLNIHTRDTDEAVWTLNYLINAACGTHTLATIN